MRKNKTNKVKSLTIKESRDVNINATKDFCAEFGYDKLRLNTVYNGFRIGAFRGNQRTKFNNLEDEAARDAMREEFNCISVSYLAKTNDIFKRKAIASTLDFCVKNGYDKLTFDTMSNDINIGAFRNSQRTIFKKLKSEADIELMKKEFDIISPDYLNKSRDARKVKGIEATRDYLKSNSLDTLKVGVKHNGVNIGIFRNTQKRKYKELRLVLYNLIIYLDRLKDEANKVSDKNHLLEADIANLSAYKKIEIAEMEEKSIALINEANELKIAVIDTCKKILTANTNLSTFSEYFKEFSKEYLE